MMGNELTDEQLMLLEQITYMEKCCETVDILYKVKNVGKMMNLFTEEKLQELESLTEPGSIGATDATGAEWAAIIRAIKDDEYLMNLELRDSNDDAGMYCFEYVPPLNDEGSTNISLQQNDAIVVFRGTVDGDEWKDNVEGLNSTDTECQIEALDFIESLPYDNITVVGHSKGANKAQYVTILSDKVKRCVAMDGQGFSQEFFDKYYAEIEEKGALITNHSLANDYVHILLFPVPGATQVFYQGVEDKYGIANHFASSFFSFQYDESGHLGFEMCPIVENEDEVMTYLREFTYFIINEMPCEKKVPVIEFVGNILATLMASEKNPYTFMYEGITYSKENIANYIFTDINSLATVGAYFIKYIDVYELEGDQVRGLLQAFGLGELLEIEIPIMITSMTSINIGTDDLVDPLVWIINLFMEQLKDGEIDPILISLLSMIKITINKGTEWEQEINLAQLWVAIELEYRKIGYVNSSTANSVGKISEGFYKDFSKATYNLLIETVDSIDKITYNSTSVWRNYAYESWYSTFSAESVISVVNTYFNNLLVINSMSKKKINNIFNEVSDCDRKNAGHIQEIRVSMKEFYSKLLSLAESIG